MKCLDLQSIIQAFWHTNLFIYQNRSPFPDSRSELLGTLQEKLVRCIDVLRNRFPSLERGGNHSFWHRACNCGYGYERWSKSLDLLWSLEGERSDHKLRCGSLCLLEGIFRTFPSILRFWKCMSKQACTGCYREAFTWVFGAFVIPTFAFTPVVQFRKSRCCRQHNRNHHHEEASLLYPCRQPWDFRLLKSMSIQGLSWWDQLSDWVLLW